jgi:phosphatidylserine/phosphatidylglycerophosphate/cardiolipin synthase-like enzyme
LPSDGEGQEADDDGEVAVDIYSGGKKTPGGTFDIVQPQGTSKFANWAATVTRDEFITRQGGVIGFAIVHSKLIVVDPFTNPIVVTGSHNFSGSASQKNDDNFIIVRGNQELALHYATHILSVYHHYSWLAYLKSLQAKGKKPDGGGYLVEGDTWQAPKLKGASKQELDFWIR